MAKPRIHNQPLKKINQLINDNIDEFEFGIDILDLKSGYLQSTEFLEDIMSKQMFSYYMKQVDDKHKKKLNNTKIDKIFMVKKSFTMKNVSNRYETLISESGLYMMASCFGKTKECEEFRKFVFEDLLVSLRKAEQETMKEVNDDWFWVGDYIET